MLKKTQISQLDFQCFWTHWRKHKVRINMFMFLRHWRHAIRSTFSSFRGNIVESTNFEVVKLCCIIVPYVSLRVHRLVWFAFCFDSRCRLLFMFYQFHLFSWGCLMLSWWCTLFTSFIIPVSMFPLPQTKHPKQTVFLVFSDRVHIFVPQVEYFSIQITNIYPGPDKMQILMTYQKIQAPPDVPRRFIGGSTVGSPLCVGYCAYSC